MVNLFVPIKSETQDLEELEEKNLPSMFVERKFGKTPFYLLINSNTDEYKVIKNTNHHFGGQDTPWDIAVNNGAEAILATHLGSRPYEGFSSKNLPIYKVDLHKPVSQIVNEYKQNQLDVMETPPIGSCCSGEDHHH